MYFWQQLTPQNSNITLVCVGDRIIYRVILPCRRFMVKYFNVSRALSPCWKLRGKGLWQDRTLTQPELWAKKCSSFLKVKLSQGLYELHQPLLISRKFFLSSLRFGCLLLRTHLPRSSQTSQGCLLPDTSSLLLCLSLGRVSGTPSKGQWHLRSKAGGNMEPPGLSPLAQETVVNKKTKKKKNQQGKMKISLLQDCCLFPVLKRPIISPSPDWMAAITNSKKYLYESAVHEGMFFAILCGKIEISKAHTKLQRLMWHAKDSSK